jgi:hypothetical protein
MLVEITMDGKTSIIISLKTFFVSTFGGMRSPPQGQKAQPKKKLTWKSDRGWPLFRTCS